MNPRRLRGIAARERVEDRIRAFFRAGGYRETRTPLLVASPGMEPHIRPIATSTGAFLPTSPELAMKKLLAGGLERIFQLAPAFRDEPSTPTHAAEFTMLEWYRAGATMETLMDEVEALIHDLAKSVGGGSHGSAGRGVEDPLTDGVIRWQGRTIATTPPWPRLEVRTLFAEAGAGGGERGAIGVAEVDATRLGEHVAPDDGWDDLFFRIWLAKVEPALPADRACFVARWPASMAALAVIDAAPDGTRWAKRFEVFAGGLELGNAFEELTDAVEQRARFERDRAERTRLHPDWPASPIDEEFLRALEEGLPPCAGIAMGVDRLVMLLADEPDLAYTRWL